MKIRTELNNLASTIRETSKNLHENGNCNLESLSSTIKSLNKNISERIDHYIIKEPSLKGRIETLQNLEGAVSELSLKAEKSLLPTEQFIDLTTTQKKITESLSASYD